MTVLQQLTQILVICLLLQTVHPIQYKPNLEARTQPRPSRLSNVGSKLRTVGAYAKGYAKGAAIMTLVLTVFRVIQLDKLFEVIFGADNSVQELTDEIMEKFDEVNDLISSTTEIVISEVSGHLMRNTKLAPQLKKIDDFLNYLKHQINKMESFIRIKDVDSKTLSDFAHSIVAHGNKSLLIQMTEVHDMLDYNKNSHLTENFMDLYIQDLARTKSNKLCHLVTSPQQTLFNLLRTLFKAEIGALELIGYAYSILAGNVTKQHAEPEAAEKENSKFVGEKRWAEKIFNDYTDMIQSLMQFYLPKLERNFWKCDSQNQKENSFQLNKMIYGIIEADWNLGDWKCYNECHEYSGHASLTHFDWEPQRKCVGWIGDCYSTDSGKFKYCYSDHPEDPFMYKYVSNDLMKVGSENLCQTDTVKSASRWTPFYKCDYCSCMCYSEDENTHRFVSLLPQMSDIKNNQVIVGVRFVKYSKKVVSLQIMQAPLLPFAGIDKSKAAWRELDDLNLLPTNYWNFPGYHAFSADHRDIYMKELEVPENSVLTGVKFVVKNGVVDLAIRHTYVDWDTGVLDVSNSFWFTENHDDGIYDPFDMKQTTRSDNCKIESFIDSISGLKYKFGASNLGSDAGQHVVPYFDAQPVVPKELIPLSGIGVAHKGEEQCGGFITPVVMTVHENYLFGETNSDF